MTAVYQQDIGAIGCLSPTHEPRVSDNLSGIIALIGQLLDRGAAYTLDRPDGKRDVYFSVRSFAGYGKLSRRRLEDLIAGARVEADELKRDPLDFALWKGAAADDWGWDSPWGRGRPGWHIECSVMSLEYLGFGFDIHGGGMDLIFPHHENEIAQSEAARPGTGPFARCWVHNGFVNVDKEKMSKSLGNFVTVRDVLARNDAEAFRWFLLSAHYRGPIQFDTVTIDDGRVIFPGVDEAEKRVDYLYATVDRLRGLVAGGATAPARLPAEVLQVRQNVEAALERADRALDDDLNTPVALAELGEVARHANELCDAAAKRKKDAAFLGAASVVAHVALVAIGRLSEELGILSTPLAEYRERTRSLRLALRGLRPGDIEEKVAERNAARAAKDFARSDAIRAELAARGVSLRDGADGTTWTVEA
jgi:cysteinyl-tRNA synthetase